MADGRTGFSAIEHGGSLARARELFAQAPTPWVDLSTGINPHSYPLLDLPATALTRLPEPGLARDLAGVAAQSYGALRAENVLPAPGTQILLPRVYGLRPPGNAVVLGPTYAEHARAAALAGHRVEETADVSRLEAADIAVVVNPNNPDGRIVSRESLLDLAARLERRGGLLVVDEAFMDVGPRGHSLCGDVDAGTIVVLRSFGKFFGLAGLRLGFAVASAAIVQRLDAAFGPWAVSGMALEYGLHALSDTGWQEAMRARLEAEAARLDGMLAEHGVAVDGGTSLFRHVTAGNADDIFRALGEAGILARRFRDRPRELRLGLPGSEAEWERLAAAMALRETGGKK
jgi:cobalamin biosynthetic protein CobC